MADGALKEFFVALGLDTDAASFASAQTAVDALETGLKKLVDWAGEAAAALGNAVISTAAYGSHLDDASKKTGFATQSLEEFSYASKLVGSDSESFQQGVVHLARKMTEAKNGSAEATAAFGKLGVRVLDSHGKMRNLEDVLNDVSDGLAKTPEGAERMGAAFGVMGKGGADAIPLLGQGSAELKRLREEYRLTVGTLTSGQVTMLDRFDDTLVLLRSFGAQVVREFAMPIVEALQPIIDKTLVWIRANRQLISDTVTKWGQRLASIITTLASGVSYLVDHFNDIVHVLKLVAVAVASVATAILILSLPALIELGAAFAVMAAEAIIAAAAAFAAWVTASLPLIGIAVLVGLIILAFDELYVFLNGGDTVIGHILNKYWDKIDAFLTKVRLAIHALGFGPQLELALSLANKLGIAGGELLGPPNPDAATHGPSNPVKVSDFVPAGAASPTASAALSSNSSSVSSTSRTQINAPINMSVTGAPGQTSTEVAGEAVRQMQAYLEGELRTAQAHQND